MNGDTLAEFFGDVIHAYTRADAIRDGVLVELPAKICNEAGIVVPIAVTTGVWSLVAPDNIEEMPCQSVEGRLWDLLWMFRAAIQAGNGDVNRIRYDVLFLMKPAAEPELVTLIAVCGPGDQGEPVITIMLPGDD